MRDILDELNNRISQDLPCVYCAVVDTRGSTPQKAGAAMLVFPDGSQRGTLGGGCVEAEVKQRSLAALGEQVAPEILTFSLDDNYGWDDGLICGGRMSMLVAPINQRVDAPTRAYYQTYQKLLESGKGSTEAVVMQSDSGLPAGSRYLFDAGNQLVASCGPDAGIEIVRENLTPLADRPGPRTKQGIAYLPVLPRITLLIVGGGHVGQAVGELASKVGFEICVVDDRDSFVSESRFPTARERKVGPIGDVLQELKPNINSATYCIIVTRGHAHDEEALYHVVDSAAAYVGMIGSKRKIRLIFEDLVAKGIKHASLERVHAPLGFDIGSQTVPEIAISIVAELIAFRNKGSTEVKARTPLRPENIAS